MKHEVSKGLVGTEAHVTPDNGASGQCEKRSPHLWAGCGKTGFDTRAPRRVTWKRRMRTGLSMDIAPMLPLMPENSPSSKPHLSLSRSDLPTELEPFTSDQGGNLSGLQLVVMGDSLDEGVN